MLCGEMHLARPLVKKTNYWGNVCWAESRANPKGVTGRSSPLERLQQQTVKVSLNAQHPCITTYCTVNQ